MRLTGNERFLDPNLVPNLDLARLATPERLAARKTLDAELAVLTKEVQDERERLTELANKPHSEWDSADWKTYKIGMLELADKRAVVTGKEMAALLLPDPSIQRKPREPNAFQRWIKEGVDGLSADEQKDYCQGAFDGMKVSKGADIFKLSDFLRAGMNDPGVFMAPTRSDDATGKETVGVTIDPTVLQELKQYGGAVEMCRAIRSATGDVRRFLHMDDGSQEGEVLSAQGSNVGDQDVTVEATEMTAKTVTSKFITVSVEFLQDDEAGMPAVIRDLAYRRIGRVMNRYVSDTQTNFPNSIVDCIQSQAVKGGAVGTDFMGASDSWRNLIKLVFAVNPAYRNRMGETGAYGLPASDAGSLGFMMHSTMEGRLFEMKDGDDRPIIIPNLRDGWSNMIGAYPYMVNDQMDDIATANNFPMAFFNGAYYGVRFVGEVMFERFYDSNTAANQTVKFLAKTRFDFGPLLYDAGTGRDVATRGKWGSVLQVAA